MWALDAGGKRLKITSVLKNYHVKMNGDKVFVNILRPYFFRPFISSTILPTNSKPEFLPVPE